MSKIVWFNEVDKNSIPIVGGKGANLGEMTKANFPIPQGFIVTAQTYFEYVNRTGLQKQIIELANKVDVTNTTALQETSRRIQELMKSRPMPPDITDDIKDAYKKMCDAKRDQVYVAARSSATAEDLPEASFAGQQATYLDVQGETGLIKAVRKCWASLYTPRAIFYRMQKGFPHEKVGIAVVVQEMIKAEVAGVMFTEEPTGQNDRIVIEGAYGLGEAVVSGMVTPDHYEVTTDFKLYNKKIANQHQMIIRSPKSLGTKVVGVQEARSNLQKLSDSKVIELAQIGKKIEAHYGSPQDIEWAVEDGKLFILQSRAITTIGEKRVPENALKGEIMTSGMGASPGSGSGKVKIVHSMDELNKVLEGDILVTKMTSPDMVPAMKKAAAIVTDDGGLTCHAAIVSRELGVPCIVGTGNITSLVKDGDVITVDATAGNVLKGVVTTGHETHELTKEEMGEAKETKTKIYMNLGVPDKAKDYKDYPVDGIGLMREEFIIATYIKEHPLKMIKEGRQQEFINKLAEGIEKVVGAFNPKPVVLRLSDFKSNEYKELVGGEEFEEDENNPMIGWRGASRYYSEEYKEAFKLELKAVKKVREKYKNLWIMIPFVRTINEIKKVNSILNEERLHRTNDFKLWLMAEIPANALLAEEFAEYCDGFSIGSNDLTQLVLGVDRDSEKLGKMGLFDSQNEAVKKAIKMIIEGAHKKGKTVSLCGQAPSNYPEFAKFLVDQKIDSMSINPDAVLKVREIVNESEKPKLNLFGWKI